jgi:hypothetical protein
VATADTLALLGHAGMGWTVLLYGVSKDRKKALPFAIFTLLGAIAAPVSTLLISLMLVVLAVFQRTDYNWTVPSAVGTLISLIVLVAQGPQDASTYWYYGLLGMLPLAGWLLAGIRDLIFKAKQLEPFSMIIGLGLIATLLAQSLLFMLLLSVVAGKQMLLYFSERNYPWKDYVRAASVIHLVLAFIAVFLVLAGGGLAFPGAGFRAALGMGAAYWIFSLLATLGIYGDRRDFAIGGSILSGVLTALFFWVQVYPYLEADRSWPKQLVELVEPATLQLPDEADESELSSALPYLVRAGWTLSEEGAYRLYRYELTDSTANAGGGAQVQGRIIARRSGFGIKKAEE